MLEGCTLIARHAWAPDQAHDVALTVVDLAGKEGELVAIDLVGGVVKGPERRDLIEIFVESVFQHRRVLAGNGVELRLGEPFLPDRDGEPSRDRHGEAKQGGGDDRPGTPDGAPPPAKL